MYVGLMDLLVCDVWVMLGFDVIVGYIMGILDFVRLVELFVDVFDYVGVGLF